MNINRRLTLVGVMLVVLSMTMATQYAVTKVGYEYSIVHPSNADIRFIGSDNSSDGRVLRVDGANGSSARVKLSFGNWSANSNKTYTAAFGIVNEELMDVNITHINVSNTTGADYTQIWLHANRSQKIEDDADSVYMWSKNSSKNSSTTTAWTLAAGNGNPADMCADGTTQLSTPWDGTRNVRYSLNDANYSISGTSDFVWVQVSIDIPAAPDAGGAHTGYIWIHFEAVSS
ncbi:MAG: hypothetical protein JW771_04130 [Candidatus Thermoplasmatota archaeon]|nr:hypothetical protein [Candidatus Thermoplasmatota archaeon]